MKTYVNFNRCQLLVYHFVSFVGLAPFNLRNNNLHPIGCARKAYALILAALCSTWACSVSIRLNSRDIPALNKFVYLGYVAMSMGTIFSSLFDFTFRSDKAIDIIGRIIAIKYELRNLGIEDNHEKNRVKFYVKIITTNCIIVLMRFIYAFYDNHLDHANELRVTLWIGNFMVFTLWHTVVLIFVETIICIRQLIESLNNKLQGASNPEDEFLANDQQNSPAISTRDQNRVSNESSQVVVTDTESIHLAVGDVQKIGKLHGELCSLAQLTTRWFTVPIIFVVLQHFTRLLFYCYSIYTRANTPLHAFEDTDTIVVFALRMMAQATMSVLELFLIADACTSLSKVGNATKTMLVKVWNKFYPEELRIEFFIFSLNLMNKPLAVSVFGFFDLGYPCLLKIFSTVFAYFIILIQFNKSQQNPDT